MTIYEYGNSSAPVVLIQPVDKQNMSGIESEIREIGRLSDKDFSLIGVKIENWNHDLSPWAAPAVFGREGFGDGANDTLEEVLKLCSDEHKLYMIGGYSLAAMFALWAAYQTDVFTAVAAASPSIWFPGFIDYMKNNNLMSHKVYLSLGDKEEKARNPVVATVGDCIREAHEMLKAKRVDCVLEWETGNHFKEPDLRTARAFAWALNEFESN